MQTYSLIIVAAPSGTGKTTIVRSLLKQDDAIKLSVSYCTRPPRVGEQNGIDYHFISLQEFLRMRDNNQFIEWAEVHNNYYATSKIWLEQQLQQGVQIILEVDWQGAQQVKKAFPNAVGVFILPPSLEELGNRLRNRGTDNQDIIMRRLLAAKNEIRHVDEFDYVIINNKLQNAVAALQSIVNAERLRFHVQAQHISKLIQYTQD